MGRQKETYHLLGWFAGNLDVSAILGVPNPVLRQAGFIRGRRSADPGTTPPKQMVGLQEAV